MDVGYGKPPVETRFQKGRSGNPGGRPGPRRQMEKRFQQALADALLADPEAPVAGRLHSALAEIAEGLVRGAVLAEPEAVRLVLDLLPEQKRNVRFPARLIRSIKTAQCVDDNAAAQSQGNLAA